MLKVEELTMLLERLLSKDSLMLTILQKILILC